MILWWEFVTLHEVRGLYVVCAHFDHVYVLCSWERIFCEKCFILILARSHACVSLSILLAMLVLNVWLSCLSMSLFSMLQCSTYIWEAHACICRLDSCITNKGEESTQFMFPGGALHQGDKKLGEMHLFRGILHSCIWVLFCTWILILLFCWWCRALLPHLEESAILEHFTSVVLSHCPCLRGRDFSHSSDLVLAFVCFWSLVWGFQLFLFFFIFSLNWLLVCVVNALIKEEIEDQSIRGPVNGLS
jgi:hypothetical protein